MKNYFDSLPLCRAIYGTEENSSLAHIIHNIGLIYYAQGKYNLALKNYDSLRINRAIFGTDEHPDIKITLNNINFLNYNRC